MSTMTLTEAEKIFDIVTDALQHDTHLNVSLSALKGYDIYQICTAIKLRIANEFLILAGRDDSEEKFSDGLKLYDGGPLLLAMRVVPDDQVDDRWARGVFDPLDPATMTFADKRLAAEETASSFGEYCRRLGQHDALYWQKIYTRLNLDYTPTSPPRNNPVFLSGDEDHETTLSRTNDPFKQASLVLLSHFLAAVLAGAYVGLLLFIAVAISEGGNWVLSFIGLDAHIARGPVAALLTPFLTLSVLAVSPSGPTDKNTKLDTAVTTILVSLALVTIAFLATGVRNFEYITMLGVVLFLFSYTELLGMFRTISTKV